MKYIIAIGLFLIILSCENSKIKLTHQRSNKKIVSEFTTPKSNQKPLDSLFLLNIIEEENLVQIKAPKGSDFLNPDSSVKIEPFKYEDFNGDNKVDVLVYLGACGTGGCIYGLFLKQYDNYYTLVFMDYLKNPKFTKEENGFLTIRSFEEVEPYNPSKFYVSTYKFAKNNYEYKLDTTIISSYELIEEKNN